MCSAVWSPAPTMLSRPRWSNPSTVGASAANSPQAASVSSAARSVLPDMLSRGVTSAASTTAAPAARKNGQIAPQPRPRPKAEAIVGWKKPFRR